MRHDIRVTGYRYALRPVEIGDADTIVALRTNAKLNRYLHTTSPHRDNQVTWIRTYLERPGDWYFVVTDGADGPAEGLVGLYDYDAVTRVAEWGRWILRTGSLAAVESALLIYRVGFETLGFREVFCRTVSDNRAVVSFHDRTGVPRIGTVPGCFDVGGCVLDAVEHRLDATVWPTVDQRLDKVAALAARLER